MTGQRQALATEISRRNALRGALTGSAAFALPWTGTAWSATAPKVPSVPFALNKAKDGIVSAFGEARIGKVGDAALPVQAIAIGGLAELNALGRNAFVRIGTDESLIMLTRNGVAFGKGAKPAAWSAKTIQQLVEAISKDRNKMRGAMLLRSTLHTAYPVALKELKTAPGKSAAALGNTLTKSAKSMGFNTGVNCTTKTITETVTRTITEYVNVWKTAEEQYEACYDKEVSRDPCKSAPLGTAGVCAAGICALESFVDIIVGVVEVTTTVVEEVVRQVVICVVPPRGFWPSPWDIPNPLDSKVIMPQPARALKPEDIDAALKLLKDLSGFLGPFGKCLLEGKWSLAQLNTPLTLAGNQVVIPYGIKVCVTAECARKMAITNVFGELGTSWTAALGVLAALSPEFAAFAATLGITAPEVVAAAVAAVGGIGSVIATAAAFILAFIILALIYGTAISAQLALHDALTNNFADGEVCIEHPSFALALIKMATLGLAASELIPPIVTG